MRPRRLAPRARALPPVAGPGCRAFRAAFLAAASHPMTGADLLVASLYEHGVRTLFGMPGSHSTAIYDALERHGGIRSILIRNEQAGAYAADGFARVTGQPGVICTTAGPGATNALT